MNAGFIALDGFIGRVNGLEHLAEATATEAAPLVQSALRATAGAGTSPDGIAWKERKKGGRAYANAAEQITVKALSNIVKISLTGPEVFGQFGASGPRRPMIPSADSELGPGVVSAMQEGASRAFDKIMGGSR